MTNVSKTEAMERLGNEYRKNARLIDENIRLRSENDKLRVEQQAIQAMIFDGGFDISPCRLCGKVIVCLPDGIPVCESCAAKE